MPSNPNPQKLKDAGMDKAFNPQPDPQSIAGMIARAYAAHMNGEQPPAPQAAPTSQTTSCPTCGSPADEDRMYALKQAADAAKQKQMQENGVDENMDPIQK